MDVNNKFRILVIDDNPAIHEDFRKVLSTKNEAERQLDNLIVGLFDRSSQQPEVNLPNYEIDSAYQGQEGLTCVKKALAEARPYALAFVDIRMPPGWDGVETIKKIWEVDKNIQIVICTAYSDYSWSDMMQQLGQNDRLIILKKPFDNIEIRQVCLALTEKWRLNQLLHHKIDNLQSSVDEQSAVLRATLEATTDGIIVTSSSQRILDFNNNFCTMWDIKPEDLYAKTFNQICQMFKELIEFPIELAEKFPSLDTTNNEQMSYHLIKCKNGKFFEFYITQLRIKEMVAGKVYGFRDVTQRKIMEKQLTHQATHDQLTNLPNRILLVDRIEQAIKHAKRARTQIAILFFDLDRFKFINDSLGHSTGDTALRIIADRLKSVVRESDTVARLGGDEFVIVLTGLQREEDCILSVKNIVETIALPVQIEGSEFNITTSVGISLYPKAGHDAESLLKNADVAMYRAKELGRNNFQFFTQDMNAYAIKRLELENNLHQALAKNEFSLHYQPQVNIQTGKIIGAEALIRWQHPKLGLVPPMDFIPLAEETGAILPIGEWVLRTACSQCKAWHDAGFKNMRIAINISGYQLKQKMFFDIVKSALEETQLDPQYLELELTESILIDNSDYVLNTLKKLKELGIHLAIDDFGTGYSSLTYLNRFPISKIKIDRSFICFMSANKSDSAIILAIISLAKSLNLTTVAEGVETEEQLKFLADNHCNEIQGYYFSRPLATEEFKQLITENISLYKIKQ